MLLRYVSLFLSFVWGLEDVCLNMPTQKQLEGTYKGFALWRSASAKNGFSDGRTQPEDQLWKAQLAIVKATNKFWECYVCQVDMTALDGEGEKQHVKFLTRGVRPTNSMSVFLRTTMPKQQMVEGGFSSVTDFLQELILEDSSASDDTDFVGGQDSGEGKCHIAGSVSRVGHIYETRHFDDTTLEPEGVPPSSSDPLDSVLRAPIRFLTSNVSPPIEGGHSHFQRGPDLLAKFIMTKQCLDSRDGDSQVLLSLRKMDAGYLGAQETLIGVLFCLKIMVEIWLFSDQFEHMGTTNGGLSSGILLKSSPWLIGMIVLYDGFEGQLLFSQQKSRSLLMSLAGIMKVLLICLLEMKWWILLWKERAYQSFRQQPGNANVEDPSGWIGQMNRGLRISAALMIVMLIVSSSTFEMAPHLVLGSFALFMLPQILFNAYHGHRHPLKPQFVFGVALARVFLPYILWSKNLDYLWKVDVGGVGALEPPGFPKVPPPQWFTATPIPREYMELFGDIAPAPRPHVLTAISLLLGAQALILVLQNYWSPRVFVPSWICDKYLPNVFDYEMDVARAAATRQQTEPTCNSVDCVICFTTVKFADYSCVVTPCQHFFHKECLLKWMEVKLECPTCRRLLPPY